jgi:beta-glucosidase
MTVLLIAGVVIIVIILSLWRMMRGVRPLTTDTNLTPEAIVPQMTLREKLWQLTGETMLVGVLKMIISELVLKRMGRFYSGYNKRWKIPAFSFTDGPRGVVIEKNNTAWPVSLARGASFDSELEERIGAAIADEAKKSGANYFGGITINLLRHPRWGRAQETYGEDPHHLGVMGSAMVKGIQSRNVMACAKHFALNSIENSRFYVDVEADERTLREVYLPHFRRVVQEGKVASLMSSYNLINGTRASENSHVLDTILRKEWGFQGFVSSDWVRGVRNGPRSIKAGTEVEMPVPLQNGRKLRRALKHGEISMAEIDEAVLRVIRTKIAYGRLSRPEEFAIGHHTIPEHFALARESALKSAVLMQNGGMLPLDPEESSRILLLGSLATRANLGDDGTSDKVHYPYAVTPLDGLRKHLANTDVSVLHADGSNIEAAAELAATVDAVIVVAGFTSRDEGEYFSSRANGPGKQLTNCGGDRTSLDLREEDIALIQAAGRANSNTVVVYQGGSAIVTHPWDQDVNAIVFQWYAGMEGGTALAQLLFGEVNFSGKLPFTIARSESDLPFFDSSAAKIHYGYYHGYTLMDKEGIEPAYPFGFGLSYTTVSYGNLHVRNEKPGKGEPIQVSCTLTNTGDMAAEEVAFLFVGFENSSVERPEKILRGFQRVFLKAGESTDISFSLRPEELTYYDPGAGKWVLEEISYRLLIGGSADSNELLSATVLIDSSGESGGR